MVDGLLYRPTLRRSSGGGDISAIGNTASIARQSDSHELAGEAVGNPFRVDEIFLGVDPA